MKRIAIIGAGPSGLTCARCFADRGHEVHVFEKREHIAGNCYDDFDQNNILRHRYGPHYFRTNSENILSWLSQFTEWIPGRYYVRSQLESIQVPMPVSLSTMTALKGELFDENKFRQYLQKERVPYELPQNAEEQCLDLVGKELYELLFKGYTKKQWGVDPKELDASITSRIPLRFDWDERYPNEKYQVMPKKGYTYMFKNMIRHSNIFLHLNMLANGDFINRLKRDFDLLIYTGPIDEYFDCRFGKLGYRSLEFEWRFYDQEYAQPCVQVNYPNKFDFTRTVEAKHITGQMVRGTSICFEYPKNDGEPFYPLLTSVSKQRFKQYEELAIEESKGPTPTYFLGRLAEYKYFNMDHVILNSVKLTNKILKGWEID